MMGALATRRQLLRSLSLLAATGAACTQAVRPAAPRPAQPDVILATTTSTQDTGLLDLLVPAFQRASGYRVKTIAVGSGQALELGRRGEADVLLVHAPEEEHGFMAEGRGLARWLVMYNDFVVVGPPDDPARLRGAASAADALQRAAGASQALWVSRGDQSGTHLLERRLWEQAGLTPQGSAWYIESGTGMLATLLIASQKRAYTLADRGTWLAGRSRLDLAIVFEGAPELRNVYHTIPVAPLPGRRVNSEGGWACAQYFISPEAQQLIAGFGRERYGEPLFVPAAGLSEEQVLGGR